MMSHHFFQDGQFLDIEVSNAATNTTSADDLAKLRKSIEILYLSVRENY